MYSKHTLFYESPKNWGYLRACANSVYQASPWGEGPGNEAKALWCTQTMFLSKQIPTIVAGRRRDAQMIEVLGAYTFLR